MAKTDARGKDDHVDYAGRIDDLRTKRHTIRILLDEYVGAGGAPPKGSDPEEFFGRLRSGWAELDAAFYELFR